MCFTPYISLSTFVIEFLLAFFFLKENHKDKLNQIIALMSFLLGIYQLNEFLICKTNLTIFTKLALTTTAILPAISISFVLIMWRKKIKYYWNILIYLPAFFYMGLFAITNFLSSAKCSTVFIQYQDLGLFGKFFGLYYLVYLLAAAILFYFASVHTKSIYEQRLMHLGMLGMLIFTVPTLVFLIFLPSYINMFPSVLCEFALLLAILFIILLWYKDKHKLKY